MSQTSLHSLALPSYINLYSQPRGGGQRDSQVLQVIIRVRSSPRLCRLTHTRCMLTGSRWGGGRRSREVGSAFTVQPRRMSQGRPVRDPRAGSTGEISAESAGMGGGG